jgi:hypothetical protein
MKPLWRFSRHGKVIFPPEADWFFAIKPVSQETCQKFDLISAFEERN